MRAELVGVPAPADYNKFFDYSIVKKDLPRSEKSRLETDAVRQTEMNLP